MILRRRFSLILGLATAAWLAQARTTFAQYACGSPTAGGGHCYAVAQWDDEPEYFGAYADIALMPMSCTGCDGFTTNELWLVDRVSAECTSNAFHRCWVEAGYMASNALGQDPFFFWADVSPAGQLRVVYPGVPGLYTENHFMLVKDARTSYPGNFLLFIYNTSHSTLFSAASSSFRPDRVIIGEELSGTTGLFSELTPFDRNIWAVQPLGPEYIFWYRPQTTSGFSVEYAPPWGQWTEYPGSPSAPEGGEFTTHCCH